MSFLCTNELKVKNNSSIFYFRTNYIKKPGLSASTKSPHLTNYGVSGLLLRPLHHPVLDLIFCEHTSVCVAERFKPIALCTIQDVGHDLVNVPHLLRRDQ